jgi:hypothetical protein
MKCFLSLAIVPCATLAGNMSLSAIAGYGFPVPGQYIGSNSTYDATSTPNTRDYDGVYGSMADGIRAGGEFGYALNECIELGLGVRYEASSEIELTQSSIYTTYRTTGVRTSTLTGIAFAPGLTYALPGEVYRPYARVSGRFGMPTQVTKYSYSTTGTGSEYNYEIEYTGGVAWGFGGGLGIEYKLSPALSLLGEVVSESWTWAPEESEYTTYVREGEDVLSEMNASERRTKYVDSYFDDGTTDTTTASKQIRSPKTFSAVSVNIGLKYRF